MKWLTPSSDPAVTLPGLAEIVAMAADSPFDLKSLSTSFNAFTGKGI